MPLTKCATHPPHHHTTTKTMIYTRAPKESNCVKEVNSVQRDFSWQFEQQSPSPKLQSLFVHTAPFHCHPARLVFQLSSPRQSGMTRCEPTFFSQSGVTMGTPLATAHMNLTVRRTASVTRCVISLTPLAMLPPSRATTASPDSSDTPVKST